MVPASIASISRHARDDHSGWGEQMTGFSVG
jgi:hypothetical protein